MPRFRTLSATLAAALALLTALPAPAFDLGGHVRDGTVVGLNFGGGWNKATKPNASNGTPSSTIANLPQRPPAARSLR